MQGKGWRILGSVLLFLLLVSVGERAEAGNVLTGNPNIFWAPDGQAFTTDWGERDYVQYPYGMTVQVGERRQQVAGVGEHVYYPDDTNDISISKWRVQYTPGVCIHRNFVTEYHGLQFRNQICHSQFKPGWFGTCADCGEEIRILIYMDAETAQSISKLPAGTDYFYGCPHCGHLETGAKLSHVCNRVSANKYRISYRKNARDATGYMDSSVFYYNNAREYEGKPVLGENRLRSCGYRRAGYVLAGWNTRADGSGEFFADRASVYNLSAVQNDEIILYAQWKRPDGTLRLDPAGGSYEGTKGITSITKAYGETYVIRRDHITCPEGYTVSFCTGAAQGVPSIQNTMTVAELVKESPFHGSLVGDVYHFSDVSGNADTVTVRYRPEPVLLPAVALEGYTFLGWYSDADCTKVAGAAGELFTPTGNVTLYAGWKEESGVSASVSRILSPHDPVFLCGESGYVDVSAWGHADCLKIQFPPEFIKYRPDLNHRFEYPHPEKTVEERVQFMVPLEVEQNRSYQIVVHAYKEGEPVEHSPVTLTISVSGSILDELRTRLR